MKPASTQAFSHAQSLRVIGQVLQALRVHSFRLEKTDYLVHIHYGLSAMATGSVAYTSADIERLDAEGRSSRGGRDTMPDARNLSLSLRILGDYLDDKGARDFVVSWSTDSVKVEYATVHHDLREETFTAQNLYDRGVHMYLRRSGRGA